MTKQSLQLTLLFTLALGITTLYAQQGQGRQGQGGGGGGGGQMMGDPKEYLEDRMADLEELLGLSDAQAVAIQALHEEFFGKLAEARSSGGDRRELMLQMRTLRDATDKEVITFLNEEQAEKYKELRAEEMKEKQERMQRRREQGGSGGRPPGGQ